MPKQGKELGAYAIIQVEGHCAVRGNRGESESEKGLECVDALKAERYDFLPDSMKARRERAKDDSKLYRLDKDKRVATN